MANVIKRYRLRTTAGSDTELAQFITNKKAEVATIMEHGEICRDWETESRRQKYKGDEALRASRRSAYVGPPLQPHDADKHV